MKVIAILWLAFAAVILVSDRIGFLFYFALAMSQLWSVAHALAPERR